MVFALFMCSMALFATLIAFLLYDDARRSRVMPIGQRAELYRASARAQISRAQISRVRLGVVAGTFLVWSMILNETSRLEPSA